MSLQCQKIEIKKLPFLASDITNFTSAVCAIVTEMSTYGGSTGEPLFESWSATYSADLFSSYTTVNSYSSEWGSADTDVNNFVYNTSASILDVNSLVNTQSANWNSVYSEFNTSSADLLTFQDGDSRYVKLSGDVMFGGLSAPSISADSIYVGNSTINFFDENYQVVETLRGDDVTKFKSNYNTVNPKSANWDSSYNTVNTYSATEWNYKGTDIKALTSNWEDTYTSFSSQSANNISVYSGFNAQSADNSSVYTIVNSNSSNWDYQGNDIKVLSSNWQNTFSDFSTQSADNISVYTQVFSQSSSWVNDSPQTLSFNEITAELSISNGNSVSLSSLSGENSTSTGAYLPLSGGTLTGDLDIQANISNVNSIQFNTSTDLAVAQGQISWNIAESTLNLGINNEVALQIGQETLIQVKNTSGEIIYNGTPVFASGASGGGSGNITVSAYRAGANDVDELYFLGVATQELADSDFGFVTTFGKVRDVVVSQVQATDDTGPLSSWDIGTILYPSATQTGKFTSTPPVAPNKDLPIAMVIAKNGNQRIFFVRAEQGYHLDELHDVARIAPAEGDVLTFNSISGVWYPKAIDTSITELTSNWEYTYTYFSAQSSNNINLYALFSSNSASWDSVYTEFNIQSGFNSSVFSTVNLNSAITWNYQGTDIKSLTSNWEDTYNTFSMQSADNLNIVTVVENNSSVWGSITPPQTLIFNEINAELSISDGNTVSLSSLSGGSGGEPLFTSWSDTYSANYESTYSTVQFNSGSWNYQGTDIKALTGNWQETFNEFSIQSANNIDVFNTVQSNSASWGGGGGSAQTLNYSEISYELSISSGNTVNLSALATNVVVLTADFSTTDNSTLQNVDNLYFYMDANKSYYFECYIQYAANTTTTGSEIGINGPASPLIIFVQGFICNSTAVEINNFTTVYGSAASNANSGGTTARNARIQGLIVNGNNSGNLHIQTKVENGVTGTITYIANSFLIWKKL